MFMVVPGYIKFILVVVNPVDIFAKQLHSDFGNHLGKQHVQPCLQGVDNSNLSIASKCLNTSGTKMTKKSLC